MRSLNFNQRRVGSDRNERGYAARTQLNVVEQTLAYGQQDLLVDYLVKSLRLYLNLVGSWRKGRNLIGTLSIGLGGPAYPLVDAGCRDSRTGNQCVMRVGYDAL